MDVAQSFELMDVIKAAGFVVLTLTGWGVRAVLKEQRDVKHEIKTLATELRSEMQQYTHRDTCKAHRDGINARLDVIHHDHERTLAMIASDRRVRLHDALEGIEQRQATCEHFDDVVKG